MTYNDYSKINYLCLLFLHNCTVIKTEKCNIIELLKNPQDTKYHFYHGGGNIENRRTIVEALVCNFDLPAINEHNHGLKEKVKVEQMELDLTG